MRVSGSRVRIITAKVAAACAITAPSTGPANTVNPPEPIRESMIGTRPQCRPKMTENCHEPPMTAPANDRRMGCTISLTSSMNRLNSEPLLRSSCSSFPSSSHSADVQKNFARPQDV